MILTIGSTTLTIADAFENPDPFVDRAVKKAATGDFKTQVAGERYAATLELLPTAAQYRTLLDMLKDKNQEAFYTPSEIPPEYSSTDFPMKIIITGHSKTQRAHNGTTVIYFVSLDIQSAVYLA